MNFLQIVREMLEKGLTLENAYEANRLYNQLILLKYTTELLPDNTTLFLRKYGRN